MRCSRFLIVALAVNAVVIGRATAAQNNDEWPPLNAVERRQTNPVRVGEEIFTSGFYSYWINAYHIGKLHRVESINWGPRSWAVAIGLGGNEPIGPHHISSGAASDKPESTNSTSVGPTASVEIGALAPMPSPSLSSTPTATFPTLAALPPAPPNGINQALPALRSLAPLPSLTP